MPSCEGCRTSKERIDQLERELQWYKDHAVAFVTDMGYTTDHGLDATFIARKVETC